ncbi:MAG: HlyD family efflux transporter periplasmic adaptor subunit [Gemmatimonadales bacterium]|nr:HlyD family efflux transporter periplasmic adaptor subunit [Gemmatimonadales bacterium]
MTTLRSSIAALATILAAAGCRSDQPDAYGTFEADEVVVASETTGRLLRFDVREGDQLTPGSTLGLVDTIPLSLERRELAARRSSARSRTTEVSAQITLLSAQRDVAERELARTRRLASAQAATAQQLDRAERDYRSLTDQIAATRTSFGTTRGEIDAIEARIAIVDDRIARSSIVTPVGGTVLTTYVEQGEIVQAGQPLYKVARLDTLTLRAFVSGDQLAAIRLGEAVTVQFDHGAGVLAQRSGQVNWIASRAEFTPTPIQTRKQRVDLVYAVKIRVANPDGALKIGMPGELVLTPTPAAAAGSR